MATYFRMPGVSADSDEAVLESWTVEQGAQVASGQTIASVETEKAVVDVESDIDAIVHTLLVGNGATVPVGDPIAILLGVDEPASEAEKLLADLGVGVAPAAGGGDAADIGRGEPGGDPAGRRRSSTPPCRRRPRRPPRRTPRRRPRRRRSTSTSGPRRPRTATGGAGSPARARAAWLASSASTSPR